MVINRNRQCCGADTQAVTFSKLTTLPGSKSLLVDKSTVGTSCIGDYGTHRSGRHAHINGRMAFAHIHVADRQLHRGAAALRAASERVTPCSEPNITDRSVTTQDYRRLRTHMRHTDKILTPGATCRQPRRLFKRYFKPAPRACFDSFHNRSKVTHFFEFITLRLQ